MEGGRGPSRGYELQVSFPNPQTMHHDMGFVPLEENHGPSFMVTSQSSPFPLPQVSVPFSSPITFSGDLISKPWNHDQVKSSEELLHKDVMGCVGTIISNLGCSCLFCCGLFLADGEFGSQACW